MQDCLQVAKLGTLTLENARDIFMTDHTTITCELRFLTARSQAIPLQSFSPVSYRGWMHINFKATVKIVFPDFQVFVFAA